VKQQRSRSVLIDRVRWLDTVPCETLPRLEQQQIAATARCAYAVDRGTPDTVGQAGLHLHSRLWRDHR